MVSRGSGLRSHGSFESVRGLLSGPKISGIAPPLFCLIFLRRYFLFSWAENDQGSALSKRKNFTVTMGQKFHEMLVKYAQGKGLKMRLIIETFIEMGIKYDVFDPDWTEKMLKAIENVNRYASLDQMCEGTAYGEDESGKGIWSCVWFRNGRPPQIRILGKTDSLKEGRCRACNKTEEIAMGFKERDLRIRELETELGSKASAVWKIPICNRGAVLTQEGLAFRTCPERHHDKPVSIEKWCRVYEGGLPCVRFAELAVGVEGKT